MFGQVMGVVFTNVFFAPGAPKSMKALPAVAVGAYVALQGLRPLARYAVGALPGGILLGAYDWGAFGAPWHDPLSYADNGFRARSRTGILGVQLPDHQQGSHGYAHHDGNERR